jgi:hypothetical protein
VLVFDVGGGTFDVRQGRPCTGCCTVLVLLRPCKGGHSMQDCCCGKQRLHTCTAHMPFPGNSAPPQT